MPKGRMINKSIGLSEKIAKLSDPASILFTWAIPHLDVAGCISNNAYALKGTVCPYRESITPANIPALITEMITADLVENHDNYLFFKGFHHEQNISHPEREAKSLFVGNLSATCQPNVNQSPEFIQSKSRVKPAQVKLSKVKLSQDKLSKVNSCSETSQAKGNLPDMRAIVDKYIETKGLDATTVSKSGEYARYLKSAKKLLAAGTLVDALACMEWLNVSFRAKNLSWTLETVVKQYPVWYSERIKTAEFASESERRGW